MNRKYITIRLPGFAASIERRFLPPGEKRPLVVITGEGTRALVISSEDRAHQQGIVPGVRVENLNPASCFIIPATLERYEHETESVKSILEDELGITVCMSTGVFTSFWPGGDRFLENAVQSAMNRIKEMGHRVSCGVSSSRVVSEIAAIITGSSRTTFVPGHAIHDFLTPLPLEVLPDLEEIHRHSLNEIGVTTLGEIALLPDVILEEMFGKDGPKLRQLALGGGRPEIHSQWRGKRRLGGDEDNQVKVREILADLIAEGVQSLQYRETEPVAILLLIVYADGRRTVARNRIPAGNHEGHWQRIAAQMCMEAWKRRVRLAEIRVTIYESKLHPAQLDLFTPVSRIGQSKRLTKAVSDTRARWGRGAVRFATSLPGTKLEGAA